MVLYDYIVSLGLDAFKEFIDEKYDERQLKKDIREYVERQLTLNFNCTHDEEVDFGGLIKYLCEQAHEDIVLRFTSETRAKRGQAHRNIIAKAASYAHAHTPAQENRIKKMANDTLTILRDFYEKKLTRKQKYLASRIADDVTQSIGNQLKEQTSSILSAIKESTVPYQDPLSHAQARKLANEGKLNTLGDALTDLTETISASHSLKPYYGYQPQTINGKQQFVSVPLTAEARELYPPHFKCTGRAYLNGQEIKGITPDIIEYAYNHQLSIRVIVDSASKLLGIHLDPQQCETECVIGKEILLSPPPFPEAMAYSISINDIVYLDYILLRATERFEDGTVILTNETQKTPINIKIRLNPNTNAMDFTVSINGGSNSDHLKYSRFLRAAHSNGRLKIHHLESDNNLLEANCAISGSDEYLDKLAEEIAFLEDVDAIEHFFRKQIDVPEQFTSEDVDLLHYVATIIREKEFKVNWTKYKMSITIEPQTKNVLTELIAKPENITYIGTSTVTIFGCELTYPLIRTFLSVKLENPTKVSQLLDILEIGEQIQIVFIPGQETGIGEYIDRLGATVDDYQIREAT